MRRYIIVLMLLLAGCQTLSPTVNTSTLPNRLINFWESASGHLNSPDEIQPFQFAARTGDGISAHVLGTGTFRLTLQTADGTVVAQSANPLEAALPADGTYTLLVQAAAAGDYELSLIYTDRPNPADYTPTPAPTEIVTPSATPPYYARFGTFVDELSSGQTVDGTFDAPEVQHVYTFTAQAGQYLGLYMERVSGTVDPVVHVYLPTGDELASDDNSGGNRAALLRNVQLPVDGLYSIQAWGRGFAGNYRLALNLVSEFIVVTPQFQPTATATPRVEEVLEPTLAPAVVGEALVDHVPVLGVIERKGDFDRYPITVTQGQLITVGVRPDTNFRAKLELFDPEGLLIMTATPATSNAGGDALIPALMAAQSGTYVAFVTGEANSTGGYSIAYGVGFSHSETRRGETVPDQIYDGNIQRRGLSEVWTVDLNRNDVISAAASIGQGNLDPVLELIAPDGALVAMDDNGGGNRDAQIASALAPVAGRYHLRVSSANASGQGAYTLVWRIISRPPTATPVPGRVLLLSYDDSVPANTYQYYTFYAQAGTQVEVHVMAQPGSSLDAVAALLAPDGSVLGQGDDEDNNINPRFYVPLPVDGTYRVRVNGYLTSGAFTLTVNALYKR
ncbi:MAG: hypothetical protein GC179_16185 [Anaerolineaceae bacterium]|nr:hypothetical protein [Anaerolineaceae bacterium]